MDIRSLNKALDVARRDFNLDRVDLFILNEIFCAENNSGTIMKIVNNPEAFASRATLHARIKRLCKNGFLVKQEDPKNMRFKNVEPGEKFKEFLIKLKGIE